MGQETTKSRLGFSVWRRLLVCCVLLLLTSSGALAYSNPACENPGTYDELGKWLFTLQSLGKKEWGVETLAKKSAQLCAARMNSNGLAAAIRQVWSGEAEWGYAIACHEGRGNTGALENDGKGGIKTNGGKCAFQIDPAAGYPWIASKLGIPLGEFVPKIRSDPVMCAKAGWVIVSAFLSSYSKKTQYGDPFIGSLCNYAGGIHASQFRKHGCCHMYKEFKYFRDMVMAAMGSGSYPSDTAVTQDDSSKPCYGCNTVTLADGEKMVFLNCFDYGEEFAAGLAKAAKAFQSAMIIGADETRKSMISATTSNPIKVSDVENEYCLKADITKFFDTIIQFLTDIDGFILNLIKSLIEDMLTKACSYIATSINTLLQSICLPLPSLSFSLDLLGVSTKSCDGVSLNDFITVSSGSPKLDWGSDSSSSSGSGSLKTFEGAFTSGAGATDALRNLMRGPPSMSFQF